MERLTRREFATLLGMSASAIALVEAGIVHPASAARDFTWASTGGAWGEHLQNIFVEKGGFSKATGLSEQHSFQLESVAASKIVAASGNPPYDISDHGDAEVVMMNDTGLLLPYKTELMPNYADISDAAKIGKVYASTSFLLFGLVWNSKEIKEAPTSFQDLKKPEFKGRVGIPAYGWYGMYWLHGFNKAIGGNEDNITPAMTVVADVVRNNKAVIIQNADHGKKLMESGEVIINPYWNGIAFQMQKDGVPTKFESVPGTLALGTGFIILKGTPYEDAANKFVNLTLDPALQVEFSSWNMYPPTNKKAVLPPDLEHIKVTDQQLANTVKLDWKKVVDHKAEYLDRWNREVLG
jgi:putative spermidine/putrescine transport system substrate-binding protein